MGEGLRLFEHDHAQKKKGRVRVIFFFFFSETTSPGVEASTSKWCSKAEAPVAMVCSLVTLRLNPKIETPVRLGAPCKIMGTRSQFFMPDQKSKKDRGGGGGFCAYHVAETTTPLPTSCDLIACH